MGWEPCGTTSRSCRSCQRSSPYGRTYFRWIPDPDDGEEDEPTRRDLKSLKDDYHGEICKGLVAYDPRAGEPKRPNTTGGGYRPGGPRIGVAFREGTHPTNFELPEDQRGRTFFRVRRPSYRALTGSPMRGDS